MIVELFDKFAVKIDGKIKYFDKREDAEQADAEHENQNRFSGIIEEYLKERGIDGKNAVGKTNIINSFLIWQATRVETALED